MRNSNRKPLVSIGIPTYNRAGGNLPKAITRALGQTYGNVEVIVSDNCSSDETPELVRSIEDPRLRYIRQETNIGPNNNFNACLNQAKGEYFLLFHDDDMIDEDFIEACISALAPDQTASVILTGNRIIDGHDNVTEQHRNEAGGMSARDFIFGWFNNKITLYLCSTLYNTNRLKEVGGFGSKKNLYDDLVPTFTLATKYGRVDVPEVKASFRRHQLNRSSSVPVAEWVEDSLYLLDVFCKLLPDEREALREKGELYFCKKMYWYASHGLALSTSPMDYLRIYKAYNYSYSPLRYWYPKILRLGKMRIKRMLEAR